MVTPTIRVVKIFLIGTLIIFILFVGVLIFWNENKTSPSKQFTLPPSNQKTQPVSTHAFDLAREKLRKNKDTWIKYAQSEWTNAGYQRQSASGIYDVNKNIDIWLVNIPDSLGILEKVQIFAQSEKNAQNLLDKTVTLLQTTNIQIVKVLPMNAGGPSKVTLPNGTFDYNPLGSEKNLGVFSNHTIRFIDNEKHVLLAQAGSAISDPNFNRKPILFLNSVTSDPAASFKTLLHEYGHSEEQLHSKPFSYTNGQGKTITGQPDTEFISTLYGIRAGELLESIIGAEAASELILKQLLLNQWITVGNLDSL